MSFKPKAPVSNREYEPRNYPTPKAGSRKARVSLIVDLGEQNREPFENDDGTFRDQEPCQQLAVFVDLVSDVVDYGGELGKQPYRLMVNKTFQGQFQGINFTVTPPKDAKGNMIKNKPWGFHPASALTKLAKATGTEEIIYDDKKNPKSLDVSELLNKPLMVQVEVKETESKDKKDKEGKPVVFKNVNFRGAAPVPTQEDEDGNDIGPIPVAELKTPAMLITFQNATKEMVKYIRYNVRKVIKQANDYAGSNMQKAIDAYEAEEDEKRNNKEEEEETSAPSPAPAKTTKATGTPKPAKPSPVEGMEDSEPF